MIGTEGFRKLGRGAALCGALFLADACASTPTIVPPTPTRPPVATPTLEVPAYGPFLESPQDQLQRKSETITSFSLEDMRDESKMKSFIGTLARYYVEATGSTNMTPMSLTDTQKLILTYNRAEFLALNNEASTLGDVYAFSDPETGVIVIDLGTFIKFRQEIGDNPGTVLAHVLFEEWIHKDVVARKDGTLLNNANNPYNKLPNGTYLWEWYQGGEVRSGDKQYLNRFEEIWADSLVRRIFAERFGIQLEPSGYHNFGTYFFEPLSKILGLSLEDFYKLHASSDVEGLATLIGAQLPGDEPPLHKGMKLFIAIHDGDREGIIATGLFGLFTQ